MLSNRKALLEPVVMTCILCNYKVVRTAVFVSTILCLLLLNVQPVIAYSGDTNNTTETGEKPCQNDSVDECVKGPAKPPNGNNPDDNTGNPINIMSGNKHQIEVDFQIPGSMLSLRRMYNSADSDSNRGLGQGWSHSYTVALMNAGNGVLQIAQSDGGRVNFYPDGTDDNGNPLYRARHSNHGYITYENNRHYWRLNDGRTLKFNLGFLVNIDWPDQREIKLYYRQKRLYTVTDETGRTLIFKYSGGSRAEALPAYEENRYSTAEGYLESVTLPDGSVIGYDYDNKRNLTRVRYPDGTSREYHYEIGTWPNHLTGVIDRTGVRFASWSYDDEGRAISSEHANGAERVTLQHPDPIAVERGELVETLVTNSLNEQSVFTWQQNGGIKQLLSSSGPGCSTCPLTGYEYTYDQAGRLLRSTRNTAGNVVGPEGLSYEYDDNGRIVAINRTDAFGVDYLVERREYDGLNIQPIRVYKPSVDPAREHVTEIQRDSRGRPITVTESGFSPLIRMPGDPEYVDGTDASPEYYPIKRTSNLEYNEIGQLLTVDGPRTDVSDITRMKYDALGRAIGVELATGGKIVIGGFDSLGRATEFRVNHGTPLKLAYDQNSNVVEVSARQQSVRYQYDGENRLIYIIDAFGKKVSMDYDDAGRMTSITDDMGLSIDYLNDTENRLIGKSFKGINGELFRSINYVFDAESRLQQSNEHTSNHSTGTALHRSRAIDYDQLNQPVSVQADNGSSVDLSYDHRGRLSSISESGAVQNEFEYDASGRQIAQIDSRGNRTETIKDDFGRIVSLISLDAGRKRYTYDAASNRVKLENANGEVTDYQWDAGNRLIRVTSIDGVTTYEYHPTNGRLTKTTNPDTSESFEYNQFAQLVKHSREINGSTYSTGVVYNKRGQIEKKLLPDGLAIRYHYHQDGVNAGSLRAITKESAFGLVQETLVAEIDLEQRDGSTGYLSHNGIRTQREFHADGSIKSIDVSDTLSLQYTFDDDGNISGINEDSVAQNYLYDRGRLAYADTRAGNYSYEYDVTANRIASLEVDKNGLESELKYRYSEKGQGNQLLAVEDVRSGRVSDYEYDDAGAALKVGSQFSYIYNTKQRPIEVYESGELVAEYRYNSFGERVWKTVYTEGVGQSTYYLYDGNTLVAEINDAKKVQSHYVYLQDKFPVVRIDGGQVFAIHTDHLGTPRRVTNENAELVWDANYTPFGKANVNVAKIDMNLRLPGQYEDTETGTHYNYYRDYDPSTGRYLTSDPIGLQGGNNLYAYLDGNPLNSTDMLGLADDMSDANILVDGVEKPVAGENFITKAAFVFGELGGYFVKAGQAKIAEMFTPENIAVMVGMMAGIAAVQFVPFLNVAVNAGLFAWAWWEFGGKAVDLFKTLISSVDAIYDATSRSGLCGVAENIANSLVDVLAELPPTKFAKILDKGKAKIEEDASKNDVNITNPKKCSTTDTCGEPPNPKNVPKTDPPATSRWDVLSNGDTIKSKRGPNYIEYNKSDKSHRDPDTGQLYQTYTNPEGKHFIFKDGKLKPVPNPDPSPEGIKNIYTGLVGEIQTSRKLASLGFQPLRKTGTQSGGYQPNSYVYDRYKGQNGIDGIYIGNDGKIVIVETKSTGKDNPTAELSTSGNGQQLSESWLAAHIAELPDAQRQVVLQAFNKGDVTLLRADVTKVDVGDVTGDNPRPPVTGEVKFTEIKFDPNDNRKVEEVKPEDVGKWNG